MPISMYTHAHTFLYYVFHVPGGDLVSIHTFDEKHTVNALAENNYIVAMTNVTSDGMATGVDQGVWIGLKAVSQVDICNLHV
jgi:hypothetical protein